MRGRGYWRGRGRGRGNWHQGYHSGPPNIPPFPLNNGYADVNPDGFNCYNQPKPRTGGHWRPRWLQNQSIGSKPFPAANPWQQSQWNSGPKSYGYGPPQHTSTPMQQSFVSNENWSEQEDRTIWPELQEPAHGIGPFERKMEREIEELKSSVISLQESVNDVQRNSLKRCLEVYGDEVPSPAADESDVTPILKMCLKKKFDVELTNQEIGQVHRGKKGKTIIAEFLHRGPNTNFRKILMGCKDPDKKGIKIYAALKTTSETKKVEKIAKILRQNGDIKQYKIDFISGLCRIRKKEGQPFQTMETVRKIKAFASKKANIVISEMEKRNRMGGKRK